MSTIYRADHCGSLIRPDHLRKARIDIVHGRMSRERLKEIEDEAILNVLDLQRQCGVSIYSDGEFRRGSWLAALSEEFFEGMHNEGIDYVRHPYLKDKPIDDPEVEVPPNPVAVGKIGLKRRITGNEIAFLKRHAPGPFKITIPSPVTLSRSAYRAGVTDRVYPAWEDLFDAFTSLIAGEIASIVADGVTYIQLDAPQYTRFIMPERRRQLTDLGLDPREELAQVIAAENKCLRAARGAGVTVAVHICLGTFVLGVPGPLGGAGSFDESVIGQLLRELEADVFLIEYTQRSGGLQSLRAAHEGKVISLGILNIRDPRVETVDEVMRAVEAASAYVPVENLGICPNCGFSGSAADAFVTEDIEKRKLEVLAEAARRVWG
jgi:5-methyltetrahydropteroyltriglutamate--homocysteine methyltransferase